MKTIALIVLMMISCYFVGTAFKIRSPEGSFALILGSAFFWAVAMEVPGAIREQRRKEAERHAAKEKAAREASNKVTLTMDRSQLPPLFLEALREAEAAKQQLSGR